MTPTLETTFLRVARTRLVHHQAEQVKACLRELNDEQIWWRPNERANSIGTLVLHLCGSSRFYLAHTVGGIEYVRDRPAEFAEQTKIPRDELLRRLHEAATEVDHVLEAFEPARLMDTTDRSGKSSTYAQIIMHQAIHFAAHTGQIVYATKLLKAGAIDELWQKTMKDEERSS